MGISGKFLKCFKGVSWKFQEFSKRVFRVLQDTFKCVSIKVQGCFKKDWRVFQWISGFKGCLKEVQWVLKGSFKNV